MLKIKTVFLLVIIVTLYCRSFQGLQIDNMKMQSETNSEISSKAFKPTLQNRVHRAGIFWLNMTNCGFFGNFIGSDEPMLDPCTQKVAPSGEMPGGSGINYIWASSLLFGGYLDSAVFNLNGINAIKFQGPLVSTALEGWKGLNGALDTPREL